MCRPRALLVPSPTVYGRLFANSFWSKLVGVTRLNMAIVSLISGACSKDCVHRSHLACLCPIQSFKLSHWAGFLTFSHMITWISHGFLPIFPSLHSLFYWAVTWLSLYPWDFQLERKLKERTLSEPQECCKGPRKDQALTDLFKSVSSGLRFHWLMLIIWTSEKFGSFSLVLFLSLGPWH